MIKKYDIITVGGATEDISFYSKDGVLVNNKNDLLRQKLFCFEYGAKMQVDKSFSSFGGGAANASVCLANFGFRVAIKACLGSDLRGKMIINNFKKHKVATNLIQKTKQAESGFSFLVVGPGGEHTVFSNRASNSYLEISPKDLKIFQNAKWIYLTSLSGQWRSVLRNIFSLQSVKIAWNPGHIQLKYGYGSLRSFFKKTEFLTLNKDEAIELVLSNKEYKEKSNRFLNTVKNLLKILKSWGPKIVIITNGRKGADAYDGENFYHIDILKEKRRVDTTGVGDAFGSSFLAGLEFFNGDIKKAMHLAVKNTASVISEQGAQNGLLSKKDIF